MNQEVFITHSEAETEQAAEQFAKTVSGGDVVALSGCVGSGKTAFVRGVAKGLGIQDRVFSPTFALVHRYRGNRALGIPALSHYDFDRLKSPEELDDSGFFEAMDSGDILALEWCERVASSLPEGTIYVQLAVDESDSNTRKITVCR